MDVAEFVTNNAGAILSFIAAALAGYWAYRARRSEAESSRVARLEELLAGKKAEMYEPLIKSIGVLMTPEQKYTVNELKRYSLEATIPEFMDSAVVYASDDVLVAFSRFRLCAQNTPHLIFMRLMSDLLEAIRRDVAGEGTQAGPLELFGHRVNDLFEDPGIFEALNTPWPELVKAQNWTPPWEGKGTSLELPTGGKRWWQRSG